MKCWFSCNHRCRRSPYEEDRRLSENRETGKREGGPKEVAAGEGCPPPQWASRAELQPDRAAEEGDDLDSPAKALLPLGTLPLKEAPQAAHPPASHPAPCFPIPHHEILDFIQELGAAQEHQSRHRRERKKDLRSCHDCLKSVKTLKENLQEVQGRLWRVEAKLGICVPPQELGLEMEDEEMEPPKEGGEGEESPPAQTPLPAAPQPGDGEEGRGAEKEAGGW